VEVRHGTLHAAADDKAQPPRYWKWTYGYTGG